MALLYCREVVMSSTGRFMGFLHSESNTSAEVFITLLDTLNHVLDATVNKDVVRDTALDTYTHALSSHHEALTLVLPPFSLCML